MPNLQDQNVTIVPSQDVVLHNTDNMGSMQQMLMKAQARYQFVRNYTTMPKYDGASVDKDNIFDCSDRLATWASTNDLGRMTLAFHKTVLPSVKPVGLGTVNYQQCNTMDEFICLLIEQFHLNMMAL